VNPAAVPVDPQAIGRAVQALLAGGLVGFPTETVYGLGADADQPQAVAAIFRVKGRPHSHPVILHLAHAAAVAQWARAVPSPAQRLIERFWPGPLTLILPRQPRATDGVTGGQDTVGLRCPSDPWAQALLKAFCAARGDPGAAIAAPSANRYGRISPTSAAHVRADLGERPQGLVDVILDGGSCQLGIESTIVDFPDGGIRILRPGSLGAEQLRAVAGEEIVLAPEGASAPRVSGRVQGHYAPRTPLEIVAPEQLPARAAQFSGQRLGVLAPVQVLAQLPADRLALYLAAAAEPELFAHELYDRLRTLDAGKAQRLLIAAPPEGPEWLAVHDRLRRAAAGSAGAFVDAD